MKFKFLNRNKIESELENQDDVLLENDSIEEKEKFIYLPTNFVVGYYEGMTQKGLKEYINGYVFKYFNAPNVTYYRMLKYNNGYIFEIHDGDSSISYLKKIMNEFNNGNINVIVKLQNRTAKVTKNINKITTYLLPESETNKFDNTIIPEKGKMKSIQTTGFGFVSFGIAIAFLGITSLFLSSLFKTVLSKNEPIIIEKQIIEEPSTFIEKLPLATNTKYISKVWFENGKWNKSEKQIKTKEMIDLEKNNIFISKISSYTKFVEKCVSKAELKECNDSSPFLDKIVPKKDDSISNIKLENGVININFKNNKDFIKFIPDFEDKKLIWNYECSKNILANVCLLPNAKVNELNKVTEKTILNNSISNSTPEEKEIAKKVVSMPKPIKEINSTIKEINNIVKDPINSFENKKIESNNKTNEINKDIPSNLDLSEIPNNIIVE